MDEAKVLKKFKEDYKTTKSGLSTQYSEAENCLRFYAGDYMKYRDRFDFNAGIRGEAKYKQVQFNRVKPYVNSVAGFFAQIRGKPVYQAVLPSNQDQLMYSEYMNGASDYVRQNANAPQIETQQDKDMLICGYGATDTSITLKEGEATRDPNGEIVIERVHPLEVGWDPEARQPNLLDARWVYRVKDYYAEDAEELFGRPQEDFEPVESETGPYSFLPGGGIQDKIAYEFADYNKRMVRVYFYQWYEIENFYRIPNPIFRATDQLAAVALFQALQQVQSNPQDELFSFVPDDEMLVITKDNGAQVRSIFQDFSIPFDPVTQRRKVYYTAIISGDRVFDYFKSPSQQGFSIKFKTGDYNDVLKCWAGMVTSMRDPVKYYNKALTELMITIAYASKGGVIIEDDAVDSIQQFERRWSKTDGVITVRSGALTSGKIQDKTRPHVPTGYEKIIELSDSAISQVTGLSESFFGVVASGNETAMLQRQKIKQATTILAVYIDNIQLYQKVQARMLLSFIRLLAESSNGKIFTTYDDNGNLVMEKLSTDFFADEYNIVVAEAPDTPLQKEYYTEILIKMAQSMQMSGDPTYKQVYAASVKYMPIPEKDKIEIIKAITGDAPIDPRIVQQLQAQIQSLTSQQQQIAMAKGIADISKAKADAEKTLAETRKTISETSYRDAETAKTLEETEKQAIENDLMALKPARDVNVTI